MPVVTTQPGAKNPNWRGGRTKASNGYILVLVGTEHHLADVRGYAYEHRLVAENSLGRRLLLGEIVHHRDGDKTNNTSGNLEVVASIAAHRHEHKGPHSKQRAPGERNVVIECECGCGTQLSRYDSSGRPRRFITGHNMKSGTL